MRIIGFLFTRKIQTCAPLVPYSKRLVCNMHHVCNKHHNFYHHNLSLWFWFISHTHFKFIQVMLISIVEEHWLAVDCEIVLDCGTDLVLL